MRMLRACAPPPPFNQSFETFILSFENGIFFPEIEFILENVMFLIPSFYWKTQLICTSNFILLRYMLMLWKCPPIIGIFYTTWCHHSSLFNILIYLINLKFKYCVEIFTFVKTRLNKLFKLWIKPPFLNYFESFIFKKIHVAFLQCPNYRLYFWKLFLGHNFGSFVRMARMRNRVEWFYGNMNIPFITPVSRLFSLTNIHAARVEATIFHGMVFKYTMGRGCIQIMKSDAHILHHIGCELSLHSVSGVLGGYHVHDFAFFKLIGSHAWRIFSISTYKNKIMSGGDACTMTTSVIMPALCVQFWCLVFIFWDQKCWDFIYLKLCFGFAMLEKEMSRCSRIILWMISL